MIDHLIQNSKCMGLVITDGIHDLILDINSPREATQIVNYLIKWTEEYNLHIHTIIHQNKGDENARGHIGTEINNKSETVLKADKGKHNESVSTVEAVYIRDITLPSFAYQINSLALPELLLNYEPSKDAKATRHVIHISTLQ